MKNAHLLLNFIFKGAQTQMISGKLLEYMATGVPLLSIGDPDSEAGKFISQGSETKMIAADNHKGIIEFIQRVANQKETLQNEFPNLDQWSRGGLTKRLVKDVLLKK
jgi:uncharacterized protein (UPF0335 family)